MSRVRTELQAVVDRARDGYAVLFASMPDADGKADAYTIQCVGHREGSTLKTDTPVDMIGFGVFRAMVGERKIMFDGGGAMSRIRGDEGDHPDFYLSYTWLDATAAQLQAMGYKSEVQLTYLSNLLAGLDGFECAECGLNYKLHQMAEAKDGTPCCLGCVDAVNTRLLD